LPKFSEDPPFTSYALSPPNLVHASAPCSAFVCCLLPAMLPCNVALNKATSCNQNFPILTNCPLSTFLPLPNIVLSNTYPSQPSNGSFLLSRGTTSRLLLFNMRTGLPQQQFFFLLILQDSSGALIQILKNPFFPNHYSGDPIED